jgi:hypothetical protein
MRVFQFIGACLPACQPATPFPGVGVVETKFSFRGPKELNSADPTSGTLQKMRPRGRRCDLTMTKKQQTFVESCARLKVALPRLGRLSELVAGPPHRRRRSRICKAQGRDTIQLGVDQASNCTHSAQVYRGGNCRRRTEEENSFFLFSSLQTT